MRTLATKQTAINQYNGFGNQLWDIAGTRPSLDLQFSDRKDLVDATTGSNLVDFTRASSGTYVDSDGLIKTATTNLLLQSEDFSTTWGFDDTTVDANAVLSPGGALTADKVVPTAVSSAHHRSQGFTPSDAPYTLSVFAKAAGYKFLQLWVNPTSGVRTARCNLLTGAISKSGSGITAAATSLPDGWYRVSMTFPALGASFIRLYILDNSENVIYTGDGTSGIYLWGAQLEQSTTVGEYVKTTSTINSAPRFDHDPTTGESLGLLVEESRTNSIRNNTMVGAVAGTPGTAPTNWNFSSLVSGLSSEIVEIGSEDNINYLDIKISGTPSSSSFLDIQPEPVNQVAASNGQAWTHSSYIKLQNGATTNASISIFVFGRDNLGNFIANELAEYGLTPTSAPLKQQRQTVTYTASSASVAYVQPRIRITFSAGAAIDITLRIGLPQLEQGAFATSVIPTEGSTVTRAADVASISGSNFSSWYRQDEGTVFGDARANTGTSLSHGLFSFHNGTLGNRMFTSVADVVAGDPVNTTVLNGGVTQAGYNAGSYSTKMAFAFGYAVNNFATAGNGSITTATSGTVPAVDRLFVGTTFTATTLNGTIRRLVYWNQRLPNDTLQTITQ